MMVVEIWEDIVCPWCYIGERRFEIGLGGFSHRDEVQVVRRSFELDPSAPAGNKQSVIELLRSKYGLSAEEAERSGQRIAELARGLGLTVRPDRFVANTHDAHRLLHLASERGLQAQLAIKLFAAHFSEGKDVSDHDVLVEAAVEAGVGKDEARKVLETDAYEAQVEADQRKARDLGVHGVPYFVVDRRYAVSGAQPPEIFLEVLETAWNEKASIPTAKAR
jgi:predicted DsbA family dithiol-disulfide isomerase